MPLLPERAREPLRPARFTGYHLDGGYAELVAADERFCFGAGGYDDLQAAPLLRAGLIGYRSLRLAGDAERLGSMASARVRIVTQVAATRAGACSPSPAQATTGAGLRPRADAEWAGDAEPGAGGALTAIIFAPAGELSAALAAAAKGGPSSAPGSMSDIPSFPARAPRRVVWLWPT